MGRENLKNFPFASWIKEIKKNFLVSEFKK